MASYRIFPSTNGPASPITYSGNFLAGVLFEVTQGGMWFEGYWWWVCPTGQSTTAQKFALWNVTGNGVGTLVPGSVVTSGTLVAGQWNFVPLSTPLPLAIGTAYTAATGVNGNFPDSTNSFGSGETYAAGVVNGPLTAYSSASGSKPPPYNESQGVFSTGGTDPSLLMPTTPSDDNFWMDLQVTDTAPVGYSGSYRLWPNKWDADDITGSDDAFNYVVATEVRLSAPCALNKIWYYSPTGTAQLATECGIWSIASNLLVATNDSPSWSGAAASGWVSCNFSGVILPAGNYRVAIYNGAATPDSWNARRLNYWDSGPGQSGIVTGPLLAPRLADASSANIYQGSGREPGQGVFALGPPNQYPDAYVDGLAQNYWVDMEVTPQGATSSSVLLALFS